jgi:hypothetical protein
MISSLERGVISRSSSPTSILQRGNRGLQGLGLGEDLEGGLGAEPPHPFGELECRHDDDDRFRARTRTIQVIRGPKLLGGSPAMRRICDIW